jgi:TP901 family phage tail tape measure protein
VARGERTFVMKFVGDARQALGEMDKLVPGLKNMSTAGKAAVGAAAVGAAAVGTAALAGLGKAISLAADYEKAIDAVGAVAGASEAQTKQLYDTGRRLGKSTAFTAVEAAAAMEELAAQGLSVDQIIGGAADATVALAAAGGVDMVTAATAAAQTMGVWGLKSEQMTDVVNRMAGAANVSKFDVADMTLALSQGAGVAAAAGVTYQDFLTTIAATATSFQSGSDAGTGFKTFVQRLVPQGKAATRAMRDLGIITKDGQNTFFDAKGNFAGMANAADVLQKALSGLTDEARTDALRDIFGSDASRTAAALAVQGRAAFEQMDRTMGGTDAADIAAQRMGNLRGELEKLKGALEDIGIGLGEKLLPPLTKVVGWLAENLPKVPANVWLVVFAVGALIGLFSLLATVALPIIAVMTLVGASFLLIPLGIAMVIASIVLLWVYWDKLIAKAREVREAILETFGLQNSGFARGTLTELGKGFANTNPLLAGIGLAKTALGFGQRGGLGGGDGEFASGGVVPGPRGASQLAIVHGGETILPTHRSRGGEAVVVNVYGNTMQSDADMQRLILSALHTAQQRGALGLA